MARIKVCECNANFKQINCTILADLPCTLQQNNILQAFSNSFSFLIVNPYAENSPSNCFIACSRRFNQLLYAYNIKQFVCIFFYQRTHTVFIPAQINFFYGICNLIRHFRTVQNNFMQSF